MGDLRYAKDRSLLKCDCYFVVCIVEGRSWEASISLSLFTIIITVIISRSIIMSSLVYPMLLGCFIQSHHALQLYFSSSSSACPPWLLQYPGSQSFPLAVHQCSGVGMILPARVQRLFFYSQNISNLFTCQWCSPWSHSQYYSLHSFVHFLTFLSMFREAPGSWGAHQAWRVHGLFILLIREWRVAIQCISSFLFLIYFPWSGFANFIEYSIVSLPSVVLPTD